MSISSISDVLSRVSAIQQQIQQLSDGSLLDGLGSASSTSSTGSTGATDFADQLSQAQGTDTTGATATATGATSGTDGSTFGSLADSALGTTGTTGVTGSAGTAATTSSSGVALPSAASSQLTSSQQQFASTLSAATGLNPGVVSAWLLSEESGGATQSRQAAGNNDWLNIGYTDSGTYGSSDSVWSNPVSAANATAQWLQGQSSIPGYGTASSGIQSILSTVGQSPTAQIQAIQQSGWSSGGYPSLPGLYQSVASGTTL